MGQPPAEDVAGASRPAGVPRTGRGTATRGALVAAALELFAAKGVEGTAVDEITTAPAVRWVCLDIGETLVDETRVWSTWAGVLGVTPLVLHAALGASIAAGGSYPHALDRFDPGWRELVAAFERAYGGFVAADLYPDALPGLAAFADAGLHVAVIGNQPASRSAELRALGIAPDAMAMSAELGAEKPSATFYELALEAMGDPDPAAVVYVGDRVDNDIRPAKALGLRAVHLRRGPWGILGPQDDGTADAVADDLAGVLAAIRTSSAR